MLPDLTMGIRVPSAKDMERLTPNDVVEWNEVVLVVMWLVAPESGYHIITQFARFAVEARFVSGVSRLVC